MGSSLRNNGWYWLPNAPLPESANYVRLCNWLELASPTAPGDPDLDSPPPSWLHLLDHLTSLWICTWPGLYLLKDKSFGVLQCILRIPSRFPNSRLLTREAICRWGILISRDIKIPHPNYFMFLCSKLIWGVFWGHRIVSKSACLIKNVYFLFLGKFYGPYYSCQTFKLSGSIRMKRRKSLYIVQLGFVLQEGHLRGVRWFGQKWYDFEL